MVSSVEKPKSLILVGHLVKDEIVASNGRLTCALGGIAYNIAAFGALLKGGVFVPRCRIGNDIRELFESQFGNCLVLDDSMITYTGLPNVINRLVYRDHHEREEWNSRKPSPLLLDGLNMKADAAIFNFISGSDVSLSDLRRFRRRFGGHIYLDYHSLALGRDRQGKRFYRRHPRWKDYAALADIVQMNLPELGTLSTGQLSVPKDIALACQEIHSQGPKIVIITMGEDGVVLSIEAGRKAYCIPPARIGRTVDPTGCGDTLAASVLCRYIQDNNIIAAAETANLYAAAKATFTGLEGFGRLQQIAGNIKSCPKAVRIF